MTREEKQAYKDGITLLGVILALPALLIGAKLWGVLAGIGLCALCLAPFGFWLFAKGSPKPEFPDERKKEKVWEKDWNVDSELEDDMFDIVHDPAYAALPGNIHYNDS